MLTELQVKDFAIITSSTLQLSQGMTTLTGETGAGKSILLGALGLVLGDRASTTTVRDGADRADITAVFDVSTCSDALEWLNDHAMDQDNECILRRVVTRDGKSRAFINGTPVTIKNLRELSRQLINIHGQHDHQLMTLPDTQRAILDDFGECDTLLASVAQHWQAWTAKKRELDTISSRLQARSDRMDTLRYQLQEFTNLNLNGTDFPSVDKEHKRLSNTTRSLPLAVGFSSLRGDTSISNLPPFIPRVCMACVRCFDSCSDALFLLAVSLAAAFVWLAASPARSVSIASMESSIDCRSSNSSRSLISREASSTRSH